MSGAEMSHYEREREKRIAENRATMETMGLLGLAKNLEPPPSNRAAPRAPRAAHPEGPTRASGRVASLPKVSYREVEDSAAEFDERRRSAPRARGPRAPSDPRQQVRRGVWDNTDFPSKEATDAAYNDAEEFINGCPNPAFTKMMLPSHVSGGFWLELPNALTKILPKASGDTGTDVFLSIGKFDPWKCNYLVRKGGGGLSAGWRGFAIQHRLAVGDVVVFEKQGVVNLAVKVWRARDYPNSMLGPLRLISDVVREAAGGAAGDSKVAALPAPSSGGAKGSAKPGGHAAQKGAQGAPGSRGRGAEQAAPGAAGGARNAPTSVKGSGQGQGAGKGSKRKAGGGGGVAAEPPLEDLGNGEGEEHFFVEYIVDEKKVRGKKFYLIKWFGYGDEENTWEPESMLNHPLSHYKWRRDFDG